MRRTDSATGRLATHQRRRRRPTPPDCYRVPSLVREYGRDLETRLAAVSDTHPEILLETLAFAEGRLLSIHPFADFNGRLTRVLLRLLLRRFDLPWVGLLPPVGEEAGYLAALHAADGNDWRPLMDVRKAVPPGGQILVSA